MYGISLMAMTQTRLKTVTWQPNSREPVLIASKGSNAHILYRK